MWSVCGTVKKILCQVSGKWSPSFVLLIKQRVANNSHTIPGVITITQFSSIIHPKLLATASEGHCTALCGVNVVLSMMNVGTVPTNNLPLSSTQEEEGPMLNQWTQEAARVHSTKLSLPRRRWRTQASGEDKHLFIFVLYLHVLVMSLLSFLPRITSWGSTQRNRNLGSEVEESEYSHETEEQKQGYYGYQMRYEISRSPDKKKGRKQISYWSDEEAVSAIKSARWG